MTQLINPFIGILAGLYLLGFLFIFYVNIASGPVTPGLSLLRALVWPIWIVTGWPEGERQ